MGKWLELELRAPRAGDSQRSGRRGASIRWKADTEVHGEGDVRRRYAPLLPVTCPFHPRNNLPTISEDVRSRYLLVDLLVESLRFHPANESRTIVFQSTCYDKKRKQKNTEG